MDPIRDHLHRHLDELTDRLAEWVAIPSIAHLWRELAEALSTRS